jgi:general secretion pathway protein E
VGPLIKLFKPLVQWFYHIWCAVKVKVWTVWTRLWHQVRPPAPSLIEFRPPFDVYTVPPEKFFRYKAIYSEMRRIVSEALKYRSDALMISVDGNGVGLHNFVDGVSRAEHFAIPMNRDMACEMMDVFRWLAGLQGYDYTPRQHGKFDVTFQGIDYECQLQLINAPTGDRNLSLVFRDHRALPIDLTVREPRELFEKMGMRRDVLEEFRTRTSEGGSVRPGIVLVSAPPQNGFNTTFNAAIRLCDPYVNRPVALERLDDMQRNGRRMDPSVVDVYDYDVRRGQKPLNLLLDVLQNKLPKIVCVRRLEEDKGFVEELCNQPSKERLVIAGLEAKDAIEAWVKARGMAESPEKFLKAVSIVLNQRLVRKLCEHCKVQYPASQQLLNELDLPAHEPAYFWKPGLPPPRPDEKPEDRPQVCPHCGGTGFDGRTGVFEMLVIDDPMRDAIQAIGKPREPKPLKEKEDKGKDEPKQLTPDEFKSEVRKVARCAGHLALAEEGIRAAACGVTSIEELRRVGVLKDPSKP